MRNVEIKKDINDFLYSRYLASFCNCVIIDNCVVKSRYKEYDINKILKFKENSIYNIAIQEDRIQTFYINKMHEKFFIDTILKDEYLSQVYKMKLIKIVVKN